MLPIAHMGIGAWLARVVRTGLPLRVLFLGTVLPDVIDKSIYYGLVLATGKRSAQLELFTGTRTIGHTLLFLGALFAWNFRKKSPVSLALALGATTHVLLDNIGEFLIPYSIYSSRIALFFPLYGWQFPVAKHQSIQEHMSMHMRPYDLIGEILGIALLLLFYWRARIKKQRELSQTDL